MKVVALEEMYSSIRIRGIEHMCECIRKLLGTNKLTTGKSQQMEVSEPMTELVFKMQEY